MDANEQDAQRRHDEIEDLRGTIDVEREAHRITRWKLDYWHHKATALEQAARDYLAFYEWHMAAACAPDLTDLLDNLADRREAVNEQFRAALAIEAGKYPA